MNKNLMKVARMALVVVISICSLAGCSKKIPAGTYETSLESTSGEEKWNVAYTFEGSKVHATATCEVTGLGIVSAETAEGTYEIAENDDGNLLLILDFDEKTDHFHDESDVYEEGDGYIMYGGIKWTKVEEEGQ